MADFSKKTQADNKHLANLTTARKVVIDGSQSSVTVRPGPGRLIRVVIWTKGLAFTINDGSIPVGNVATTTPENSYDVGIYCENNIKITGISGTGSALIVFDV